MKLLWYVEMFIDCEQNIPCINPPLNIGVLKWIPLYGTLYFLNHFIHISRRSLTRPYYQTEKNTDRSLTLFSPFSGGMVVELSQFLVSGMGIDSGVS